MISDVPIGTFLSGGIDSSIISLISNKQKLIKAFNISFSDKEFDESETAKNFAKNNNIDFNKKLFDNIDLKQLLEDNIAAYTEPFSDYSSLPTLLLSKFAKTKVTVALSGDGGDELFYGYDRNRKYGSQAALLTSSKVNKIYKILKSKLTRKLLKLPIYEILSNNNIALFESNFITGSKPLGKKIMPKIYRNKYIIGLYNMVC
jgi:asparagine synthase (glutamine-hydrolysing)